MKKDRVEAIYRILQENSQVSVEELVSQLKVSPATVRRTLQLMEDEKLLTRYYGGAILNKDQEIEPNMYAKHLVNMEEKRQIARYAASLINNNDIIYIDAGTTTEMMVDYIYAKNVLVVTQALSVLNKLYEKQIRCYTLGGYIKFRTNIIIDNDVIERISKLHFSSAFLGTNAIHPFLGFSTTNEIEALLKKAIIDNTDSPYILADTSKFDQLSNVKFADADAAYIITNRSSSQPDFSAYRKVIVI